MNRPARVRATRRHAPSALLASLATALLLLAAARGARAQDAPVDPRDVEDPRQVTDPRQAKDPRDVAVADPLQEDAGPRLYDALYEAGQESRLADAFRENAWEILGYIDGHCEAWLSMVERGDEQTEAGRQKIEAMKTKARRLAQLADNAIGTSRFGLYVDTFLGWNADQQKQLREGQDLYRKAIRIMHDATSLQQAQTALTPLQQALSHSRALSDLWGQTMALTAIGSLQFDAGQANEAKATLGEALRLGRELRDLDSVWDALSMRYEMSMRGRDWDGAENALKEQLVIAQDVGDEDVQARVWQQLVNLDWYRNAVPSPKEVP